MGRGVRILACAAIIGVAVIYLAPPVYKFPAASPFSGPALFNPYARTSGHWQLANLHSHGPAWGHVPDGRQSDAELAAAYRAAGYAVAGIADHQRLATPGTPSLPIYEHGYSIGKRHQLAIGARRVDWFDFPLWQGVDQKQFVIERLKQSATLVAIAHPDERDAYTRADFERLSGYDLIEVINGPDRNVRLWDAALSTGHPVWAVADDDSHDIHDPDDTLVGWNMIDAPTSQNADILEALKAGRTYAVAGEGARNEVRLVSAVVEGSRLVVTCDGTPLRYTFIGQGGRILQRTGAGRVAAYDIAAGDTYVRVDIKTAHGHAYLNPIVRYGGAGLSMPAVTVDAVGTWIHRAAVAGGVVLLSLWLQVGFRHPRLRRRPRAEARRAGPEGNRRPARQHLLLLHERGVMAAGAHWWIRLSRLRRRRRFRTACHHPHEPITSR